MSRRLDFVGTGPIIFEGRELPLVAKLFDCVSFWGTLPSDTKDWLMDLHYCWGRTRQLRSRRIIQHIKLVRQKLEQEGASAAEPLRESFPNATDADLAEAVADWRNSLDVIEECAQKGPLCKWTIVAQDECLESNLKLAIKMCRDGVAGAAPFLQDAAPGFEFRLRSMPRGEQLKWLESFSETLSKKKTWWQHFLAGWREG